MLHNENTNTYFAAEVAKSKFAVYIYRRNFFVIFTLITDTLLLKILKSILSVLSFSIVSKTIGNQQFNMVHIVHTIVDVFCNMFRYYVIISFLTITYHLILKY